MPTKKPSGAANRKAKRDREERQRASQKKRDEGLAVRGSQLGECADQATAHLWTLRVLTDQLHRIQIDAAIESEEDRWKMTNQTASTIGMLQTKADLERRVRDLEARLNAALDEVAARRAELERTTRD
jgi:hypothetical protein